MPPGTASGVRHCPDTSHTWYSRSSQDGRSSLMLETRVRRGRVDGRVRKEEKGRNHYNDDFVLSFKDNDCCE